jgi:hypothetical protein
MNPNILVRRSLRLRYHILSFCDRKLTLAQVFSLCIFPLMNCRIIRNTMTLLSSFKYSYHCWRNFANPVVEASKPRCHTQSLAQVCNLCLQNRWSKFATSILFPFLVSDRTIHIPLRRMSQRHPTDINRIIKPINNTPCLQNLPHLLID